MRVETSCRLKNFRQFIIVSICSDFIPASFEDDVTIFPERHDLGKVIIEAKEKETIMMKEEVTFVKVAEVDRVIYNSKSGSTQLIWTIVKKDMGKVRGEASLNSLVNLVTAKVISDDSYRRLVTNHSS